MCGQESEQNGRETILNRMVFVLQSRSMTAHPIGISVVRREAGECKLGHYDGNFIQTIKGFLYEGQMITTRIFTWSLERKNEVFLTWSSVNNCTNH
jgi:hypothetical protein